MDLLRYVWFTRNIPSTFHKFISFIFYWCSSRAHHFCFISIYVSRRDSLDFIDTKDAYLCQGMWNARYENGIPVLLNVKGKILEFSVNVPLQRSPSSKNSSSPGDVCDETTRKLVDKCFLKFLENLISKLSWPSSWTFQPTGTIHISLLLLWALHCTCRL